jgi:hypothetical protein
MRQNLFMSLRVQRVVDLSETSFPLEGIVLGDEDLLVPAEQLDRLSRVLEGADVVVSARLDK